MRYSILLTDGANEVKCSIHVVGSDRFKSHAGIFILLNGHAIKGSMSFERLPHGLPQKSLLLALRFRLTEIANRGLVAF